MQQRFTTRAVALLLTAALIVGLSATAGAQVGSVTAGRPIPGPPRPIPSQTDPGDEPQSVDPIDAENWVDPVPQTGFSEDDLEPIPTFDFGQFHRSAVFASGVDRVAVVDDPIPAARVRHLRILQLDATLRRELNLSRSILRILRPRVRELNREIRHERAEEARLADEVAALKEAIAEYAIRVFMNEDDMATLLSDDATELLENRVVVDQLRTGHFTDIDVRETELLERQTHRSRLESERANVQAEIRLVQARRDLRNRQLGENLVLADRSAAGYTNLLHERLTSDVVGTDIQLVMLNAYVVAERVLAVERPECGLKWWMLAGIGHIESLHGQIFGNELDLAGYPTEDIRGIALDGRILSGAEFLEDGATLPEPTNRTETIEVDTEPPAPDGGEGGEGGDGEEDVPPPVPVIKRLALIRDTDDGEFDGDTVYDRAVGPMQFIPQTWRTYGADANLDGVKDPQNVYDATVASGRYLCAAAGSMATEEGQKVGYFAYNHDDEYTADVLASSARSRLAIVVPIEFSPLTVTSELGVFDPPDLTKLARPGFVDSLRIAVSGTSP